MASIRLTKEMKDVLVVGLMENKKVEFDKRKKKVREGFIDLADRIYKDTFSAKNIEKMRALPKGWLSESEDITFYVNGSFERLYFGMGVYDNNYNQDKWDERFLNEYNPRAYTKDHPIARKFFGLKTEIEKIRKDRDFIRSKIIGALNSVTTLKKLLSVWPEIEEVVPEKWLLENPEVGEITNLPAVLIPDLNRLLGLPFKKGVV